MVFKFLKEKKLWLFLFLMMQCVIVLASWLDVQFSTYSAIYIVAVNFILLIMFLILAYSRETKFYSALLQNIPTKEIEHKELNKTPYEKITFDYIQNLEKHTRQLIHSQNKELQLNKNDLLEWIHEVKTPMTAMKLLLEQLEQTKLTDDLLHEWSRIDYLLDQQLYIRRLTSKANDFYFGKYSLKKMIVAEIQHARNISISRGIGYDLQVQDREVYTDEKWCRTLIRQVISNALKYSNHEDIVIKTITKNNQTILQIQDFGRGIQAKDLPRIYDRGFTSTTNQRDTTATGMGLYLAKEIAKGLSININIQSTFGEGTSVFLVFPTLNQFVNIESSSDKNVT